MIEGHRAQAVSRALSCEGDYLVVAQDTTYYNYSGHSAMEGLGFIQGDIRGIIGHNALLMSQSGIPLGVIHQEHWTRDGGMDYQGEKESEKWEKGLKAANASLGGKGKRVVVVQDREADIFSLFKAQRAEGVELLVRVFQPRRVDVLDIEGLGTVHLPDLRECLPGFGQTSARIYVSGKPALLTLSLKAGRVLVHPRKDLSPQLHGTEGLSVVVAEEVARVEERTGKDIYEESGRALWLLLTSLPIDSREDLIRAVGFYSLRWGVERLHFTLKSGALNVERMQFDDIHTAVNALAFHAIAAWKFLSMTYWVRENEQEPASSIFEGDELKVIQRLSGKKAAPTVKDAVLIAAKLVGFAPSKKQPMPGVKVLAQALQCLHFMTFGFRINDS